MVHGYSGKPGFGEERGKLPAAENAQAVNNGLPPAVAVLQAASASCPDLTRLHGHDSCCLPSTCPAGPPACASGIRFDPAAEPGDEPQQLARGGKAALGQQMQAAPEQASQLIGTRVGKFLRPGKRLSQPAREACPHQHGVRQRAAEQHAVEQGAAAENIRSAIQRGEVHEAQLRRGAGSERARQAVLLRALHVQGAAVIQEKPPAGQEVYLLCPYVQVQQPAAVEALQRAEQPGRQLQGLLRREGAGPLLEERREAGRLGKGAQDAAALRLLKEQAPRAGEVELLRLAMPRRVFTMSQVLYAVDRITWLHENRDLVGGLRWVEEASSLRFFFGRLEPTSDWQEKLVKKFRDDFGDSL